ncbi:MAG TPA: thioredoxin reductase, partial [Clostridiales bacterium]|nr:thioredoxin reductase [Clostridiales bacterium]
MGFELNFDSSSLKNNVKKINENEMYDVLIIGGGPAGLNSALYATRNGLKAGIIAEKYGGQVLDTSSVENYLGYESIPGEDLVGAFREHVEKYDIPIKKDSRVEKVEKKDERFYLSMSDGTQLKSKTLIIATGSKPRKLNVPGEEEFSGKGVAYCAICDGPLFQGRDVVVAGGGNSAVEAAIDIAKIANKVYLVQRSVLRAEQALVDKLTTFENVEIHLGTQVKEIFGEKLVKGIKVYDKTNDKEFDIKADGIFVEIGSLPNSGPFRDLVKTLPNGEIEIDCSC